MDAKIALQEAKELEKAMKAYSAEKSFFIVFYHFYCFLLFFIIFIVFYCFLLFFIVFYQFI